MDSRGAGYWVCDGCGHHNLRQLNLCVSCDAPAPHSPAAKYASSPRAHATPARNTSTYTPTSPSRALDQSPIDRRADVSERVGTPASPRRDAPLSSSYSSPTYPSYGSPTRTHHAAAFVQDLDNKNAVIARLEKHIQAMIDQQRQQKRAHEAEINTIESQMNNAVEAHRLLMSEYRQIAADLTARNTELAIAQSEINSLNDKLSAESKRRLESEEANLTELEQKQRELRQTKERVATLEEELQDAHEQVARLARKDVSASRGGNVTSPSYGGARSASHGLQLTEMAARNEELSATVERLRFDLDASHKALADAKERYSEDLRNVMREATAANERAVAGVTAELHKVREAAEMSANRDRSYVEHQLRDANELATRLQGQLEREGARYAERVKELELTIKNLQEQRDGLMEEGRFTAEIQQDYVKETTSLKAEVQQLQAALRDAERRRVGAAPAALSNANSSHGAPGASPKPAVVSSDDVQAMETSVRSSTAGSPTAVPMTDDTASRLKAAEEALGQKDATISSLRGKLENQAAALETKTEELRQAQEQVEALREALSMCQEEVEEMRAAGPSPPSAAGGGADGGKVAHLEEQLETLESKYSFDTGELRKQVQNLQKKMKDREGDIAELSEENDALRAELDAAKANGGGAASASSGAASGAAVPEALQRELQDLKDSLSLAVEARDMKDELLETKEKEFEAQRTQLMDGMQRLSDENKTLRTDLHNLREDLDAANRALEDSEAVCRDALKSLATS